MQVHELHLHGANAGYKSHDLLQPVGREHATFGMPDQCTVYAGSQGGANVYKRVSSDECVVKSMRGMSVY